MKKRLQVHIFGRVQGVWFRGSTQRKAQEIQLCGFVRNEPDGSVYLEIEGPEEVLADMIEWCWKGPELAKVTDVKIKETNFLNEEGFTIQR